MKTFTPVCKVLMIVLALFLHPSARGQKMLNPADTIVTYDSLHPPVQPAPGKIGKWVRTVVMDWNSNSYKCYIYNGSDFRLHFPQTYKPNDGKKYPILVFYHGYGEVGPIYDNESQLRNGGLIFHKAENAGTFDGYIIFMQNQFGWGTNQFNNLQHLIDTLVQEYGGDPYRVIQNGLSGGGQGVWQQLVLNPTYFAGSIPMSAALTQDATPADVNVLKFTPMWNLDGELDTEVPPYMAQQVASAFQSQGGNYVYTNFTTLGHDTWDSTWLLPNFWPFINNVYLSNPWPLFNKRDFCAGDSVRTTLGIVPGLAGYQWRRNGTPIPNATADSIVVTQPGIYDARVLRGSAWSDWSHVPVNVYSMASPPTFTARQPTCTVATGTLTILTPGGPGLKYSIDGIHYTSDTTIDSVAPGSYQLVVQDSAAGCHSAASPVVINVQPRTPSVPTVTIVQPSCSVPAGSMYLSDSLGTGLLYSIQNANFLAVDSFTGLKPNTYQVLAKDTDGCISPGATAIIRSQPPTPGAPLLALTQPSCTVPTGTITVTSGADSGYRYSIDGTSSQLSTTFSGLASGGHYVTAQNSSGCTSPSSTALILVPPSPPPAPAVSITQPTCTVPTGTIVITTAADTGLTYSINGTAYQSDTTFNDLAAGNYPVTAESSNGCTSAATPAIIQVAGGTPAMPTVAVLQPTCTVATGTITIDAPTGTGLLYSMDGTTWLADTSFSGIAPGSYQISVKNDEGCISPSAVAMVLVPPTNCKACPVISHDAFSNFIGSANPGTATTLWLTIHIPLTPNQLTKNGDFISYSGGSLSLTGIRSSADSSISLPGGEIIVDNTVSNPTTAYNSSTDSWVTRVPPAYSSSDLFIAGTAINSTTGFTPSGTSSVTVLSGTFSSNKSFSSSWYYGLACYQPGFTNSTVGSINSDDDIPVAAHRTGTPNDQISGLVTGGSGNGGTNYTGSYSSSDKFSACGGPADSSNNVSIAVYPNPWSNVVNFNITSSESGRGLLQFYSLLGQRLATVESEFITGISQTIVCPMGFAHQQPVVYIFTIGKKKMQGTLMPAKL